MASAAQIANRKRFAAMVKGKNAGKGKAPAGNAPVKKIAGKKMPKKAKKGGK